ncbi:MAG: RICIN domain-containing protein [Bacteroidota bacterium]
MREFFIIGVDNRYLDGGGAANNAYSNKFLNSNEQKWIIEPLTGADADWVKLKCVGNGLYLDGQSPNDGNANVYTNSSLDNDNQKWKIVYTGYLALYYLENKAGHRLLNFSYQDNNVTVKIPADATLGRNQQFDFRPVGF